MSDKRPVMVSAIQMDCSEDPSNNIERAEVLVRKAAGEGARLIVLPELFEHRYFPKDQARRNFELAQPADGHPTVERFRAVARETGAAIPVSIYERAGNAYFNAIVMLDADGSVMGTYRKSHIPDGPGYTEKFHFSPGDTGFKVWRTQVGVIGVGICWDQWFPEAARAMVLMGAEILLYPTAIGSEPSDPSIDTSGAWRRVMQGHAAANCVPLLAANRFGREEGSSQTVDFYGTSFICDQTGDVVDDAGRGQEAVLTATFDLDEIRVDRAEFGLFRDRRPDLYGALMSLTGGS
jgi:N-carbamoylputrescine amidase